jgi:RNA polymerase sigma-70 factor, ECF subfamily
MPSSSAVETTGYTSDAAGFDAFYGVTARALYRQLLALCGDVEEARDCLQEGYVRAWQNWDRICTYDDPGQWVRMVSRRIAINRWHRARRSVRAWSKHDRPDPLGEPPPDFVALVQALRRIPRFQREAIVLHHLMGLTVHEIASETRTAPGTIKARLSRGRSTLASILRQGDMQ